MNLEKEKNIIYQVEEYFGKFECHCDAWSTLGQVSSDTATVTIGCKYIYIYLSFSLFLPQSIDLYINQICSNKILTLKNLCKEFLIIYYYYFTSPYFINLSQKNLQGFLGKTGWYFPELFLNSIISYICTSFKKVIQQISYRPGNFHKSSYLNYVDIQLVLKFINSSGKYHTVSQKNP